MHKVMEELEKMHKAKETLMEAVSAELAMGREVLNNPVLVDQLGKAIDMVKDLSEASEKCMKKKYYEMLICEMMEMDDSMDEAGRMGYDNWRHSNGRFAKKGSGQNVGHGSHLRMGYVPVDMPFPRVVPPYYPEIMSGDEEFRYGYGDGRNTRNRGGSSSGSERSNNSNGNSNTRMGYPMDDSMWPDERSEKGIAYDEYRKAKKHYHESGDQNSSMEMNSKIESASMEAMDGIREMWRDGSPETRKKVKSGLTNLMQEMDMK